jgi:hypothetical protein
MQAAAERGWPATAWHVEFARGPAEEEQDPHLWCIVAGPSTRKVIAPG